MEQLPTARPSFQPSLLKNRQFLALWAAQVLSQTAANALTFALIVLVFQRTQTNTASSYLILLAILPAILFGTLAGVMVDRSDRKLVLVTTNLARAVVVGLMLFLGRDVLAAYVVNFLVAAVTVFFVPAEAATIPKIVRTEDLLAANSLFSFTFNGAFLFGFMILAPIALPLAGFEGLFLILIAMYAVSAFLCSLLPAAGAVTQRLTVDVAGETVQVTRRGMSEAWQYLRAHPQLTWVLVYVALMYMLIAIAGALAPGFVTSALNLREEDVYVLGPPLGVGILLGLGALNGLGKRVERAAAIRWGLFVTAVALGGMASARNGLLKVRELLGRDGDPQPYFVALVVVSVLILGAAYIFVTVPSFTLLQEQLADDMRGRIFGVLNTLVSVVSLAPLIVVGPVADTYGVDWVLLGASLVVLAVLVVGRGAHLPRGALPSSS